MRVVIQAVAASLVLNGLFAGIPLSTPCTGSSAWTHCTVSNTGSSIDIHATDTQPGSGGTSGTGGDGGDDSIPSPTPSASCVPSTRNLCRGNYEVASLPDVTVDDLASFVPARPSLTSEPAGVGVVGMPENFIATASEQRLSGRLFSYDVTVRFTPVGFRFSYGDGDARFSRNGGAGWAAQGQPQFTPTSTSHAYGARGTFTASVTVLYSAAVDFGTGAWRPVDGYVEAHSVGYDIRIVEARTALVDKTCLERPNGPGC